MLSSSRGSAKSRKGEAKVHTLTKEDIVKKWETQKGLCFYSKMKMVCQGRSNWQMSIERLDNSKGYTEENTVLCCLEFNHSKQWSTEKINRIFELIDTKLDMSLFEKELNFAAEISKKSGGARKMLDFEKIVVDNIILLKCHLCLEFKNDFLWEKNRGCKSCRANRALKTNDCIRGRLKALLRAAKSSTSDGNKNASLHRQSLVCNLTFEDLLNQLKAQKGRCFYSNIIFNYETNSDWLVSLERQNPFKGYIKDNICLICREFNTGDSRTKGIGNENTGGGFWNVEKFTEFKKSYLDHSSLP